jgi:hypothetical protein
MKDPIMNDFDTWLSKGLSQNRPDLAFQNQLKQQSSQALASGHRKRRWVRSISLTCALLALTLTAFLSGQHTAQTPPTQYAGTSHRPGQESTSVVVSQDLVSWLEAGRFFEQLGMEQRATNAFRQASQMTDQVQPQIFSSSQDHKGSTYAALLTRCDHVIQQQRSHTDTYHNIKPFIILAHSLGDQNHDQ